MFWKKLMNIRMFLKADNCQIPYPGFMFPIYSWQNVNLGDKFRNPLKVMAFVAKNGHQSGTIVITVARWWVMGCRVPWFLFGCVEDYPVTIKKDSSRILAREINIPGEMRESASWVYFFCSLLFQLFPRSFYLFCSLITWNQGSGPLIGTVTNLNLFYGVKKSGSFSQIFQIFRKTINVL